MRPASMQVHGVLMVVIGVVMLSGLTVGGTAVAGQVPPVQSFSTTTASNGWLNTARNNSTTQIKEAAWPMSCGNSANTCHIDTAGPTSPLTTRWTFRTERGKILPPVVVNGTVYFVTGNSTVFGADAWTGEELWSFRLSKSGVATSIAVYRNTVYISNRKGKVYALDTATGDVFWTFETVGGARGLTVANGTVYVTSKGSGPHVPAGHVYALGALRGEEKWRYTARSPSGPAGPMRGNPAVADGNVYVASRYGNLYSLDAKTGKEQWIFEFNGKFPPSPSVADGIIYQGSDRSDLYAIDAKTGTQRWYRNFESSSAVSSPTLVGESAYIGTNGDGLHAINALTGETRWRISSLNNRPVVVNGTVYVSQGRSVYALDSNTGVKYTRLTADGPDVTVRSSPVVLNGSLYITYSFNDTKYGGYEYSKLYVLGTPAFTYSNLSVTPRSADPKEPVTASVTVTNTGTAPGTFNATLVVDGDTVNATSGKLEAGTSRTVTFTYVFRENGTYSVGVGGQNRSVGVGDAIPISTPTLPATPTLTDTAGGGEGTPTAAGTPKPTPGFGVGIWLVAFTVLAWLVGFRKRG